MSAGKIILIIFLLPVCLCRIMEKIETVCNGPCGRLVASCPPNHRVAIRDAVYRVQDKTPACTAFPGCSDRNQDVCCDPTPQDCVFPFSPTHLRAVLRNCSGNQDCVIQTERSEVETVACSSNDPANTSSQTALNYVCVEENKVADICSFHETTVEGKTLFAMVNTRGDQKFAKGSVCTCMAESTRWPTTNSIAVFLVDLRMSKKKSKKCSNVSLSMRSGSNVKKLDCESSQDPRVNFPFVAILNDSNVATLRLAMAHHLPEFVWIGFEANEDEDIRLTCKLQGVLPTHTSTDAPDVDGNDNSDDKEDDENKIDENIDDIGKKDDEPDNRRDENKSRKKTRSKGKTGAVVGGALAAIVLILVIIVIVVIFLIRRRKRFHRSCDADMDVYYSIDSTMDTSSTFKTGQGANGSKANLPVPQRSKSNKRVRIISTPDFLEEKLPEYTTAVEVRERKRASQQPGLTQKKSNNYDHLRGDHERQCDSILDSYDQLNCVDEGPPPYSSIHGLQGNQSSKCNTPEPHSHGNVNETYEDTEVVSSKDINTTPAEKNTAGNCDSLYFELEKSLNVVRGTISNEDNEVTSTEPKDLNTKSDNNPSNLLTLNVPSFSTSSSSPPSPTYNDAISMAEPSPDPASKQPYDAAAAASKPSVPSPASKHRQSFPTAAPRKKVSTDSRASHYDYDIAQPIQE